MAVYHRQSSDEYIKSFVIINLFFETGNIYKQLTYLPGDDPEEYELISTRTYDHYLDKFNPFPMTNSFPYDGIQNQLPTYHRLEENNADLSYNMSYEFNTEGAVSKRDLTGPAGTEVTYYEYY